MHNIGINVSSDVLYGTENFMSCIAAQGFNSIFTCGNDENYIDYVRKTAEANGLIYEALHAPFNSINRIWDKEEGKKEAAVLCRSVELAEANGIGIVVMHLSSGENCPPITDAGLCNIDDIINFAAKRNITIAFENQRKLANLAMVFELYGNDSNVRFCWDVGHEKCFAHGREYMPLFGDRCITTHIHDNCMIYNVDEHLLPFDGSIDFRRTAELLKMYNYTGTLMLEIDLPREDSEKYKNLSLEQFVQKAYASINRLRIISEY